MSKPRARKTTGTAANPALSPNWPLLALALVGAAITGYLTWVAWIGGATVLCAAESGCDVIQRSRWSEVMGLPLALWGLLFYGLLAGLAWRGTNRLKDWRRLWTLALLAVGMSVYLTAVGIWNLGAVCLWCLASLATYTGILALLTVLRPASAPGMPWQNWLINRGVVAVLAVAALHFYYNYDRLLTSPPDPQLSALATHLNDSGAVYYGASWCPACQQQEALFGAAKDKLPYVECSPQGRHGPTALACTRAQIRSFPTWDIDGERYEGILEPRELAGHSGFDWSE